MHGFDAGWDQLQLGWIEGYDLFTGRVLPVPVALVDTIYTLPSPHPVAFPRSTRGLAAGTTMLAAIIHAALEVLERASVAAAERYPRSWPELRIDPASVGGPLSSARFSPGSQAADLVAGIWLVPGEHRPAGLPLPGHRDGTRTGKSRRCRVKGSPATSPMTAPWPGRSWRRHRRGSRRLPAHARTSPAPPIPSATTAPNSMREGKPFRSPGETAALPADGDEPASGAAALGAVSMR